MLKKWKHCLAIVLGIFFMLPASAWTQGCSTEKGTVTGLGDYIYDMKIVGNLAYVAAGSAGFRIVDLSDPEHPALISGSTVPIPEIALRLTVENNHAYVSAGKGYLYVIDVSVPSSAWRTDYINLGSSSSDHGKGVAVKDNYAYVVNANSGLHVVNIANPENIFEDGAFFTDWVTSIALFGNYAYIGRTTGLTIVNISNPQQPSLAGGSTGYGAIARMVIIEPYLYVAANGDFYVYNLTNPSSPGFEVRYITWGANTNNLAISSDGLFAYLLNAATFSTNLEVVNISNLHIPVQECVQQIPSLQSVGIYNKLAVAGGNREIKTLDYNLPSVLTITVDSSRGRVEGKIIGQQNLIINCGDGQTDCWELLEPGTNVELTALPKQYHTFEIWTDGLVFSSDNPLPLTVLSDKQWECVISRPPEITINLDHNLGRVEGRIVIDEEVQEELIINCGDGHADCVERIPLGTEIQLKMMPVEEGYMPHRWEQENNPTPIYTNPYTLTINGDEALTAAFRSVPRFSQNDAEWRTDQLGFCTNCTIGSDGCAISVISMVYNYFQANYTNPEQLNAALIALGQGVGYDDCPDEEDDNGNVITVYGYCCVDWDAIVPNNVIVGPIIVIDDDNYQTSLGNAVDAALLAGNLVIARVNGFHYVVLLEKVERSIAGGGNTYRIIDPYDGAMHLLDNAPLGEDGIYTVNYVRVYTKNWLAN